MGGNISRIEILGCPLFWICTVFLGLGFCSIMLWIRLNVCWFGFSCLDMYYVLLPIRLFNAILSLQNKKKLNFSDDNLYCSYVVDDTAEESESIIGENKTGFGGICKDCRLPSNISITLVIDGLSDGLV